MPGPFPSLSYSIAWLRSNRPQDLWECCWLQNEWVVRREHRAVKCKVNYLHGVGWGGTPDLGLKYRGAACPGVLEQRLWSLSLFVHYRHLNLRSAVELSLFIYLFDVLTLGNFLGKGKNKALKFKAKSLTKVSWELFSNTGKGGHFTEYLQAHCTFT